VEAGTLSKQHLQKCFDWKMQRGMDRTNLLGSKVANLTDEHVRAAYDSAFRLLPEGAVPAADHLKLVRSVVAKLTKPLLGEIPDPPRWSPPRRSLNAQVDWLARCSMDELWCDCSARVVRRLGCAPTQGWGPRWRP
jgi:hypothetical protein